MRKEAPFTEEQVVSLNGYQKCGMFHPFTCFGRCREDLIATVDGWTCPGCDYTQNWAHEFMLNGEWKKSVEAMREMNNRMRARLRNSVDRTEPTQTGTGLADL